MLSLVANLPAEVVRVVSTTKIRQMATRYAGDARFVELWKMLFEPVYGPITMTEVV
jgi:hypothetical protein